MKTALITGANKGIGFETARQLLEAGYFVFLGARQREAGEQAVARLRDIGLNQVEVLLIDVTDGPSLEAAARQVSQQMGHLDVLVNNAGIRGAMPQPPSSFPVSAIQAIFDTNFFGVIRATQAFLPLLRQAPAPRIVNVTSELASLSLHQQPDWRFYSFKGAGYAPSKTALNAYTVMLAHELANTSFKINAVNPGYTATDFNQHAGEQHPTDAARIIVYYALLDESGPSGTFVEADGVIPW